MGNIPSASFFDYSGELKISQDELASIEEKSFNTHSTDDKVSRAFHETAHVLSAPWRLFLRSAAHIIEPFPGQHKKLTKHKFPQALLKLGVRIAAIAVAILVLPVALVSLPIALPFHIYSHVHRSAVGFIHNPDAKRNVQQDPQSLHVRTHNLGFVYEFFRVIGDLRDVKTRAAEIGDWVVGDPEAPEVICFQESFHVDGTRVLCDKLKEKYPYVIHSIAPHAFGLNNGGVIASMHPIKEFSFRPFEDLIGPEKLSTRGLLKIRIEKDGKLVDVYSTHTQALLGKERALVRKNELNQIAKWMEEDAKIGPKAHKRILMGDLNSSRVTAWGEENLEDDAFFKVMDEKFDDLFLKDHDEQGRRSKDDAQFVKKDSPTGVKLEEPSGSWYTGPFANKGLIIKAKEWVDRWLHKTTARKIISGKEVPQDHGWGTQEWYKRQHAKTARFDYILGVKGELEGKVEIRRVKVAPNTESAPSDHAPVDGIIQM